MTRFSELHDASSKPWIQLGSFTALVFLLLTPNCSGLSQVVDPSQQVLATVGGDVLLSCRLEPAVDASAMSIEWSREDLDPSYVYVWWDKEELESSKHPAYKGRTSLLFSELKFGDVSLKLSKVKLSDKGKYRCFIPALGQGATVELVVGDFFMSQSSYISIMVGLAAAIILLILAVVLFVRTGRQKRKMKTLERTVKRKKKEYDDIKNQLQQEKQKNETLNSRLMKVQGEKEKLMETKESLLDEKLRLMETERKLKTVIQNMNKELDGMNFGTNSDPTGSDVKNQLEELEKLQDEKQKWMETVGNLKTELQNMNQELKLAGPITVEEVNEEGCFIRLKNISSEEIKLGGWELKLQINDREKAMCTFKESVKLQAGEILSICRPGFYTTRPDDVNLEWSELNKWRPEDKLQINIISNNGETFTLL
ncbi:prelamin-A/C-like [Amphiprion ocellaris]|uniref:prelamin-A/C-like n=1 Tax=Amphiprion ocellaris TaxID=80972 RepID=UPI0024114267|nr:prelamin-A/C-like [Amphiprion ocellaris]XP_054863489.1 prelamin-A/C-like [Amphiprion ocellaris]